LAFRRTPLKLVRLKAEKNQIPPEGGTTNRIRPRCNYWHSF
jgi:hypothetical protein